MILYIIYLIIFISIATYVGLILMNKLKNSHNVGLFIFIYIVCVIGIINVLLLTKFWQKIQHKTGPPGRRGLQGDTGDIGMTGNCGDICKTKQCAVDILEYLNEIYKNKTKDKKAFIKNKYIITKAKQMCHSHQYNLLVPHKGGNNLVNYIKELWLIWFNLLYKYGGRKFLEDKYANDSFSWKNGINPFFELEKYDAFHWGLSQEFKGIGLGVCYNIENSNYFPKAPKPPIAFLRTNSYKLMGKTSAPNKGSISFWSPVPTTYQNEYYYPIMQVPLRNDNYEKNPKYRLNNKYYKELLSNKVVKNAQTIKSSMGKLRIELSSDNFIKKFDIGQYPNVSVYNMTGLGTSNSKFRVPEGYKIIFYTKTNYGGDQKIIIGPNIDSFSNINNVSSTDTNYYNSFKVEFNEIGDGPDRETLLVTGSKEYIKPPISYKFIWKSTGSSSGVYFWENKHGVVGEPGYWNKLGTFNIENIPGNIRNNKVSRIYVSEGYELKIYNESIEKRKPNEEYGLIRGPKYIPDLKDGIPYYKTGQRKSKKLVFKTRRWTEHHYNDIISSFELKKIDDNEKGLEFSIWRPIAPKGFVCLSDVVVPGIKNPKPINNNTPHPIMCISDKFFDKYNDPFEFNFTNDNGSVKMHQYPTSGRRGFISRLIKGRKRRSGYNDFQVNWNRLGCYEHNLIPGFKNNAISKIKVDGDVGATLYDEGCGKGNQRTFVGPIYVKDLNKSGINDDASAVRLFLKNMKDVKLSNKDPKVIYSNFNDYVLLDKKDELTIVGYNSGKYNIDMSYSNNNFHGEDMINYIKKMGLEGFRAELGYLDRIFDSERVPSSQSFYRINLDDKSSNGLYQTVIKSKVNIEEVNDDLGLGWYGNPTREAKHSVFTYLGMMPEGIIAHNSSNLKYYILHSGVMMKKKSTVKGIPDKTSPENSYLILQYNEKSKQYDLALSTTITIGKVDSIPMNKNEINQLWSIERINDDKFRFVSLDKPNSYLSIKPNDNLRGHPIIKTIPKSTINNGKNDTTIFTNNKSSFGSSINVITNDKYKKSDKHINLSPKDTPYRYINDIYKPYS